MSRKFSTLAELIWSQRDAVCRDFFTTLSELEASDAYQSSLGNQQGRARLLTYIKFLVHGLRSDPTPFLDYTRAIGEERALQGWILKDILTVTKAMIKAVWGVVMPHVLSRVDPDALMRITAEVNYLESLFAKNRFTLAEAYLGVRERLIERQSRYLEEIYEEVHTISAAAFSPDPSNAALHLRGVVAKLHQAVNATGCGVILWHGSAGSKAGEYNHIGMGPNLLDQPNEILVRIARRIQRSGDLFTFRLRESHDHRGAEMYRATIVRVPGGTRPYGWLYVLRNGRQGHLSRDEQNLLRSIGTAIGIRVGNDRVFMQLQEKERLLSQLMVQTIRAQEDERKRIATDFHDAGIQLLIGARYQLEAIRAGLSLGCSPATIENSIQLAIKRIDQVEGEIRRVIENIRPPLLDDLGLIPCLDSLVRTFEHETGIKASLHVHRGPLKKIQPEVQMAIYRIVQEGLNNVYRHARATQVRVVAAKLNEFIEITVEDNGKGMPKWDLKHLAEKHKFGLIGMRERAASLGGSMDVTTSQLGGTRLSVAIPVQIGR